MNINATDLGVNIPAAVGMFIGIKALDRSSVVDEAYRRGPFLAVTMNPCGGHATYHREADVPAHNVPCPCGNPKHWLIYYDNPEAVPK